MSDNKSLSKVDRDNSQVIHQICYNLAEIVESNPEMTFAEHIASIVRRKKEDGPRFNSWSNAELLRNVEQHKTELETVGLTDNK